ncbi:MAG: sugar-binding protein [Sedimentisphaeraceae bacterium JB056]
MMKRILSCLFIISITGVLSFGADDTATKKWHQWRKARDKFPIAAWAYFDRFDGSYEEYKTYADANLTMVSIPEDMRHYENATKAGLDVIIGGWMYLHEKPEVVERLLSFPSTTAENVAGYQLKDEPEPTIFEGLARAHQMIYEKDQRNVLIITDMLPGWAWMKNTRRAERFEMNYDEMIAHWIETAKPPVIINCHYAPMLDGSDRDDMYADKELMRKHALLNNIGNMSFISAAAYRDWYRVPSESDFYWQVYTCLAYGSKGIWYWNWRIKPVKDVFFEGLVTYKDDKPTESYEYVKNVNAEVLALGDLLLKLRSRNVWHTGEVVPQGTTRFVPMPDSGSSVIYDFVGDDFIVSEFDNQDDSADKSTYVMLVNKRHGAGKLSSDPSLKAEAIFKPADYYGFVYHYPQSDKAVLLEPFEYNGEKGYYKISLEGGKGAMLRFSRKPVDIFIADRPQQRLEFARRVPTVDGELNDGIWQKSESLELKKPADSEGTIKESGLVKAAWRDNQLWICADFQDSDIIALGDENGQDHYRLGDCLEIFLKPEYSDWYWEIWVNPKGNYTTLFWNKKGDKAAKTFEFDVVCKKTDTGWYVEAELPFDGLLQNGELLKQGQWTILAARQNHTGKVDIKTRELSSWPGLTKSNFHLLNEFAKLNFALY